MRSILIPAIASAALFTLPAFAQENSSSGSQGDSAQTQQMRTMSQDKLRSALEQAGFSNIQILDTAYLVQAKTQDDETVMMMINPPNMGGASGQGGSGSGSMDQSQSGSGSDSSGSGQQQ